MEPPRNLLPPPEPCRTLQLCRDRILLFFMVYAFTVDVYLAGSGVSLQLNNAATVVHDSDHIPPRFQESLLRGEPTTVQTTVRICPAYERLRTVGRGVKAFSRVLLWPALRSIWRLAGL